MCIKKSPCFGFFTLVKYVLKVCMYEGFLNFTDICCNVYSIISNFINLDILFCLVWLRIVDLVYLFKDPICFSLIFFYCLFAYILLISVLILLFLTTIMGLAYSGFQIPYGKSFHFYLRLLRLHFLIG